MSRTSNQVLWIMLWFLSIQVWSSEQTIIDPTVNLTDQDDGKHGPEEDKRSDTDEYALKVKIELTEGIEVKINFVDDEYQPEEITETKNQNLNVPKIQMIKNPNEIPIESSFQKNQWFQRWMIQLIHNKKFRRHIVNLIYSYVYEPFVPMNGKLCHHDGGYRSGVISRNGQWILSGSQSSPQYLYLSDLSNRNKLQTFKPPSGSGDDLHSWAFADSRLFVVGGGRDASIYLWNTNSGDLLTTLFGHEASVTCLCVASNDTRIVSGSADWTIRMWSVEHTPGNCLFVLRGHTDRIRTCFVSADTTRIVSTSIFGSLRVWDSHTKECIQSRLVESVTLESAIMSEDNQYVGSVIPGSIRMKVWNINNWDCVKIIRHESSGQFRIFYLSLDRLVFGIETGRITGVCVWDLETNKAIYTIEFGVTVKFNAYVQIYKGTVDRKYLIIVNKYNKTTTWMKVYSLDDGVLIN